jgi:hypothetical protein
MTPLTGLTTVKQIAMSSNGQYQLVVSGGTLYLSSNTGTTFTAISTSVFSPTIIGTPTWSAGAISASGQYMMVSVFGGYVYVSTNYNKKRKVI